MIENENDHNVLVRKIMFVLYNYNCPCAEL